VENVLFGRYQMVPSQIKDYVFGLYGRPPSPVDPEIQQKCLKGYERGEQAIGCRPADILEPELDKARQALKDMTEAEEDVLTYALFPATGLRFLKWKYGIEEAPSEVAPKTFEDIRREDELIEKAKAGLLVERADKEVHPKESAVAVCGKVDGAETPMGARNVPEKDTAGEEMGEGPASILIAVDGSEQSFEAVRYVSRLFVPGRGNFALLHVMDRVPDVYWDLHDRPGPAYKLVGGLHWVSEQQKAMEGFFEECRRIFDEAGHPRGSTVLRLQEKKVGIARDIGLEAEKGYDALVVGRRGLSPLKDILFGSIANKLLSPVEAHPGLRGEDPCLDEHSQRGVALQRDSPEKDLPSRRMGPGHAPARGRLGEAGDRGMRQSQDGNEGLL